MAGNSSPRQKKVRESQLVQLFKYKSCSIEKEVHEDMKRPYHLEHASWEKKPAQSFFT